MGEGAEGDDTVSLMPIWYHQSCFPATRDRVDRASLQYIVAVQYVVLVLECTNVNASKKKSVKCNVDWQNLTIMRQQIVTHATKSRLHRVRVRLTICCRLYPKIFLLYHLWQLGRNLLPVFTKNLQYHRHPNNIKRRFIFHRKETKIM